MTRDLEVGGQVLLWEAELLNGSSGNLKLNGNGLWVKLIIDGPK